MFLRDLVGVFEKFEKFKRPMFEKFGWSVTNG